MSNNKEIERVHAEHVMSAFAVVLSHSAGFGIELFGGVGQLATLRIDRGEDGRFWVRFKMDSGADRFVEEPFEDVRGAVAYYLDLRDEFKIGVDYEATEVKRV